MSYTLKDSQETRDGWLRLAYSSSYAYAAGSFTPTSSYTLTKVALYLLKVSAPTFPITVYIYSDSSDTPNVAIATATNTIDSSTLSTSTYGWFEALFNGIALTSGTKYHIVIYASSFSTTNWVRWGYYATVTGQTVKYSANGTTWIIEDSSGQLDFRTYITDATGSYVPIILQQHEGFKC
jgi:hypothetical protein